MFHYSHIASVALVVSLGVACDNASDDQQKAKNAQTQANTAIAAANSQAVQQAKAAQGAADQTIAAADANFKKLRDDYRAESTKSLGDVDRKVGLLETTSTAGRTQAQLEVDARLKEIRAKRGEYNADRQALDSAPQGNWDAQKARLDRELVELSALVDKATPPEVARRANERSPAAP